MPSHPYNISSKSINRIKICSHLRSLNVRRFGTVESTLLNSMDLRSSSTSSPHTRFHPNSPIGSKVIKGFLCTHLRSLNVRHFGMAEATTLKMWHWGLFNGIICLQISWKSTDRFKVVIGEHRKARARAHTHTHTHTHTHRLVIW
jgi:hypothetical protein